MPSNPALPSPVTRFSYELAKDSSGAGKYRGGLGLRREYEILADDVLLSSNGDRHNSAPWGVAGGSAAPTSTLLLLRNGKSTALEAASNVSLQRGDRLTLTLCGGGGYGDPRHRDLAAIRADLQSGRISVAAAQKDYGFVAGGSTAEK